MVSDGVRCVYTLGGRLPVSVKRTNGRAKAHRADVENMLTASEFSTKQISRFDTRTQTIGVLLRDGLVEGPTLSSVCCG